MNMHYGDQENATSSHCPHRLLLYWCIWTVPMHANE